MGAIMTLAAILLKFPSDVITNEIPEAPLLRFLKGKDQISVTFAWNMVINGEKM